MSSDILFDYQVVLDYQVLSDYAHEGHNIMSFWWVAILWRAVQEKNPVQEKLNTCQQHWISTLFITQQSDGRWSILVSNWSEDRVFFSYPCCIDLHCVPTENRYPLLYRQVYRQPSHSAPPQLPEVYLKLYISIISRVQSYLHPDSRSVQQATLICLSSWIAYWVNTSSPLKTRLHMHFEPTTRVNRIAACIFLGGECAVV